MQPKDRMGIYGINLLETYGHHFEETQSMDTFGLFTVFDNCI